jgi:tRNA(Ile)-lysidine synthase
VLRQVTPALDLRVHVAHLNHGIRGQAADADAAFVAQLAAEWQLPASVERVDVPALARAQKLALEEAARVARYAFLARVAAQTGSHTVAVAHHADDQVETVLMHWLRGSGIAGLRGMLPAMLLSEYRLPGQEPGEPGGEARPAPTAAPGHPLRLIRPLLEVSRAEIEAYCTRHELHPRSDSSNLDTTYFRNRLRHELIPYLETYNANIRQVLRRSAAVMAADYDLLHGEMQAAWQQTVRIASEVAVTFDLPAWQSLPLSLKRSTLRQAIHRLRRGLRNINFVHVENAVEIASDGETGAQATLPQGLMLTIGYDTATLADRAYQVLPDLPLLMGDQPLPVTVPGDTRLPNTGWLLRAGRVERAEGEPGAAIDDQAWLAAGRRSWQVYLDEQVVGPWPALRARRPGDRFCPLGMEGHSKRVNEFMINEKVPAAWRDHVPLLVNADGQIVWVCGWRPDQRACITPATRRAIRFRFERS